MNLAEIRKKAQKEKSLADAAADRENAPPQPAAEETVPAHLPDSSEESPLVPDREIAPLPVPESSGKVFDPVAVLLAGRQAAARPDQASPTSETAVAEDDDAPKYLCFRVATEDYAVNLMDIKEIIKPREVTEVPHTPKFVEGIISLRGMIVPILDMRRRLGFPGSPPAGRERFVIVKRGEGFCGLHVDEVYQVITLAHQPIERPPALLEGTDREFVSGIGRHDERIHILVDLEKVLDIDLV